MGKRLWNILFYLYFKFSIFYKRSTIYAFQPLMVIMCRRTVLPFLAMVNNIFTLECYKKTYIYIYIFIGILCYTFFYSWNIRMLPVANFHTLGAGALLSYLWFFENKITFNYFIKNSKIFFVVSLFLFIGILLVMNNNSLALSKIGIIYGIRETLLATVTFFLLLSTLTGWKGFAGIVVNNRIIQYFGKISYGIYLYHKPVPFFTSVLFSKLGIVTKSSIILICSYVLITLTVSAISYKFIETPFLKLKEKFDK